MDAVEKYVRSKIGEPFVWGVNDCLTFANGAVEALTGVSVYDEWLGDYTTDKAALLRYERFKRNSGFNNIVEAIDARFNRSHTLHPKHGDLVARPVVGAVLGYAFGVCINGNLALMSEQGVMKSAPEVDDIYWTVE